MKFKDFLKGAAIAPLVAPALPFLGAAALLKKEDKPAPAPAPAAPAPIYNITIINNGQPSQIGLGDGSGPAAPATPGTSPGLPNGDPAAPTAAAAGPAGGAPDFSGIFAMLSKLLASLTDLLKKLDVAPAADAAAPKAA